MIRLIALDLDGTTVRHDGTVSPANREAIAFARSKGAVVVLASGRIINSVRMKARELELTGPIIGANGAQTAMGVDAAVESRFIDPSDVRAILARAKEEATVNWQVYTADCIHRRVVHEKYSYSMQQAPEMSFILHKEYDTFVPYERGAFMVTVYGEDDGPERIGAELPGHLSGFSSWAHNIDVTVRGVSKGTALERVAKELGIARDEIMAIGDNGNDVPMIRFAGVGVAVANGADEAKNAARYVTAACEDDGVAQAIRRFV